MLHLYFKTIQMVHEFNFSDIRSFYDSEVNTYLRILLQDEHFQNIMQYVYSDPAKMEQAKLLLEHFYSVKDLQTKFVAPLVEDLILKRTTNGITCNGLENIEKDKSYLFISNHRDIILDAVLMNYLIIQQGLAATEIAIGNNLLIENWIEYVVKLNRCFSVSRNLPARELLIASKKISAYIHHNVTQLNTSVWIAQREGRTKDGNDRTQPALLKMLNLCNKGSFSEGFKELRIVPLSISYEIEPCGISKVAELYQKQTGVFEKTKEHDRRSMEEGLFKPKGQIHFGFGNPVTSELDLFEKEESLAGRIEKLANRIDQQIHINYKLWPNNYIAEDISLNVSDNAAYYSTEQYYFFTCMLNEAVSLIPGDANPIRSMFLKMYANPLINKQKALLYQDL